MTIVPYFPSAGHDHPPDRHDAARPYTPPGAGGVSRRVRLGPGLVETIAARCTESSSGARNVENILSRSLLPELSAEILSRLAEGEAVGRINVGLKPDGGFSYGVEAR